MMRMILTLRKSEDHCRGDCSCGILEPKSRERRECLRERIRLTTDGGGGGKIENGIHVVRTRKGEYGQV